VLEAETAINNLGLTEQRYNRAVTKNIKNIYLENNKNNIRNKKECKIIIDVKNKTSTNKLTITKQTKEKQ
jgi:hypothetical protein